MAYNVQNLVCGFDNIMHRGQHDVLNLQQPLLDGTACLPRRNGLVKLHLFQLAAVHPDDVEGVVEFQVVDAFEALLQMRLNTRRIFRFRQNLEHLVIRQEKESERQPHQFQMQIIPFTKYLRMLGRMSAHVQCFEMVLMGR